MVSLVIILAVAVIAVLVISGIVWAVREDSKDEKKEKTMPVLVQRQAAEKEANKQKILKFLENKEKITNNDVEKLLGVSNATAERYLGELEKEGVLKQVGDIGQGVYYIKT
ncbi:MAG: hypothetical protein A2998_03020 [Candidatus Staskawiczbacteria bacterium RIFCSPLOWO2_01_FULL_37_25b]|uniref:HTH deoR-type domain-containing protein n=1 Tax=Candidatus Staskawiczbacteria bacterium RIFCSPLOWO2_01_FULL_37_25b TaxID=1802213 RepID=A0A1G2IHF7_9BACT|nr:MAG: hypothetical protein A2998_03020 [Candidatus Staskawiczbacteria bacterium RIFCSPLOWO2_01_FULL_37_25b]